MSRPLTRHSKKKKVSNNKITYERGETITDTTKNTKKREQLVQTVLY